MTLTFVQSLQFGLGGVISSFFILAIAAALLWLDHFFGKWLWRWIASRPRAMLKETDQ